MRIRSARSRVGGHTAGSAVDNRTLVDVVQAGPTVCARREADGNPRTEEWVFSLAAGQPAVVHAEQPVDVQEQADDTGQKRDETLPHQHDQQRQEVLTVEDKVTGVIQRTHGSGTVGDEGGHCEELACAECGQQNGGDGVHLVPRLFHVGGALDHGPVVEINRSIPFPAGRLADANHNVILIPIAARGRHEVILELDRVDDAVHPCPDRLGRIPGPFQGRTPDP